MVVAPAADGLQVCGATIEDADAVDDGPFDYAALFAAGDEALAEVAVDLGGFDF